MSVIIKINSAVYLNLAEYFAEKINCLNCQEDTKAYIVSIFQKYRTASFDYSKDSVTLLYARAKNTQSFAEFQNIADWIFYSEILFPESLNSASADYYQTVAKMSYFTCYKLIQRKWKCFDELADQYSYIVDKTKQIITD